MKINIQAKTDYSALFSSLNTNSSKNSPAGDLSGLLSDYSSIKRGTYGKLLKAYYAKEPSAAKGNNTTTTDKKITANAETSVYNKVSTSADSLQKSIDTLSSLDASKDATETLKAVQNYVKDYNSFLSASGDTGNSTITGRTETIKAATASYNKQLSSLGINVGSDGKLSLDEDAFNKADKSGMSSLFSAKASYGYSVKVSAGMAASNANYESTKTSLYTSNGSYNISTGTLMDSLM